MADTKLNIIITAKDQASKTIGGISGALGSIGKFATGAAVVGIGAAAAGVGALATGIGVLAKDAAKLGPITDAFDAINESIGVNADEMLRSLSKASGGLITNTDLMKEFNTAAQLVNKDFATKLPDAMQYLGRVAGATGQDLDFLLSSLVTGVGRLSPMILDNLGIQVDLTAAYDEYAASIGKTTKELTKSEQQTALMNQVMTKLQENTEGMTSIQDPFQQISVTFQNLKDTVAQTIGPVILPLIQQLADTFSTFVQSDQFQAWLANVVQWMQEKLIPALMNFVNWLITDLPVAIQTAKAFFDSILSLFQNDLPQAISNLRAWWESDFNMIRTIVEGLFTHLSLIFDTFKAAFEGDWRRVGENLRQILENIKNTITRLFKQAWENVKNIDWLALGKAIIQGIGDGIKAMGDWLKQTALDVISAVGDVIKGFFNIESPSKLMEYYGEQIMRGLGGGIKSNVNMPVQAMNTAASGMASSAQLAATPAGGGGSIVINLNAPVIGFADKYQLADELAGIIDTHMRRRRG